MASTYIEIGPSVLATILNEVEVTNDVGNPVPVSAIDLDIRDLDSLSDSITPVPEITTTGTPSAVIVSTTAVLLKAANANRLAILITNNGTGNLYIGHTAGVTSSGATMGLIVPVNASYADSGYGLYTGDLYGIYGEVAAAENVSISERT